MRRPQRHVARSRQAKPLRDPDEKRPESDSSRRAEPDLPHRGILRLQRTIGNQAVQRLIVQRAPEGGGDKTKGEKPASAVVANLTLENQGKLEEMKLDSFQFGDVTSAMAVRQIEVVFTKAIDSASVALHKAFVQGELITTAKFDFKRRGEDGALETVQTFEFTKGHVTSLSTGGGSDRPVDFVSVQFEKPS